MNGLTPLDPDFCEFVEVDPTERYGRYNEILGKGASKTVYRAFDEFEGIEVAWNQVKLYDFLQSPEDLERLYCEIHLLKTLKHKNIMKFYTSWVDIANRNINFVTEMFTSGTLRQYRQKHKRVNIRAIKHWCRQILKGLLYLHSRDPPVIHRDLKCDNIFINGNQGEVKIGDLGLAAILRKSHAAHCVGTPEFMAPEVYEEEYNELVDIYSFGMCILEMVTFEYPYSECTHPAQIYKKVISGKKPDALYKVKDPEVRKFVEKCLATVSRRLPAKELLKDSFLQNDDSEADLRPIEYLAEINGMGPLLRQPLLQLHHGTCSLINEYSNDLELSLNLEFDNGWGFHPVEIETDGIELFTHHEDEHSPNEDITIKGKRKEDGSIFLRIRIADKEVRIRNIYFPFNIETDTALSVATEMVAELDITVQDVTKIADIIDTEIASLVPEWMPGPGSEETPRLTSVSFCDNCTSKGSLMEYISLNNPGATNVQVLQCSRHGCTSMHGRFEEITYQVEESEQCVTDGAPMVSSQSDGIQYTDVWPQHESPRLSSEGSNEPHFDEGLKQLDFSSSAKIDRMIGTSAIIMANHIETNARNSMQCLPDYHTSLTFPAPDCDSDDYENEIRREMRWLKARYQLELRDLKNRQLGAKSKGPIQCLGSDDKEHKIENLVARSPILTSVQGESDEQSKSFASERSFSSYFAHVQNSCPNSETRRARHCEATTKSSSSEQMFTANSFYAGALLPHSLHRTTSVPVDAVDLQFNDL